MSERGQRAPIPQSAIGQAGGPTAQGWNGIPERATVRVAEPLTSQEQARLQAALERYFKRPIQIEEELTPEIIGGVWVRVGDTVIDGSLRGRLETLSHHLCARCRVMLSSSLV
jgi:hypothetical protein